MRAPLLAILTLLLPVPALLRAEIGLRSEPGKGGTVAEEPRKTTPTPPTPPKEAPPKETPKPKKPLTGKAAEAEKAMDAHFASYDRDKNGKLNLAEFRSAFRALDMGESPRLFKEVDGDKDEHLDREEFGRIPPDKILTKNEKDDLSGRDWKREREKRERERDRDRDRK